MSDNSTYEVTITITNILKEQDGNYLSLYFAGEDISNFTVNFSEEDVEDGEIVHTEDELEGEVDITVQYEDEEPWYKEETKTVTGEDNITFELEPEAWDATIIFNGISYQDAAENILLKFSGDYIDDFERNVTAGEYDSGENKVEAVEEDLIGEVHFDTDYTEDDDWSTNPFWSWAIPILITLFFFGYMAYDAIMYPKENVYEEDVDNDRDLEDAYSIKIILEGIQEEAHLEHISIFIDYDKEEYDDIEVAIHEDDYDSETNTAVIETDDNVIDNSTIRLEVDNEKIWEYDYPNISHGEYDYRQPSWQVTEDEEIEYNILYEHQELEGETESNNSLGVTEDNGDTLSTTILGVEINEGNIKSANTSAPDTHLNVTKISVNINNLNPELDFIEELFVNSEYIKTNIITKTPSLEYSPAIISDEGQIEQTNTLGVEVNTGDIKSYQTLGVETNTGDINSSKTLAGSIELTPSIKEVNINTKNPETNLKINKEIQTELSEINLTSLIPSLILEKVQDIYLSTKKTNIDINTMPAFLEKYEDVKIIHDISEINIQTLSHNLDLTRKIDLNVNKVSVVNEVKTPLIEIENNAKIKAYLSEISINTYEVNIEADYKDNVIVNPGIENINLNTLDINLSLTREINIEVSTTNIKPEINDTHINIIANQNLEVNYKNISPNTFGPEIAIMDVDRILKPDTLNLKPETNIPKIIRGQELKLKETKKIETNLFKPDNLTTENILISTGFSSLTANTLIPDLKLDIINKSEKTITDIGINEIKFLIGNNLSAGKKDISLNILEASIKLSNIISTEKVGLSSYTVPGKLMIDTNLKIDYEDINIELLKPGFEIGISLLVDDQEISSYTVPGKLMIDTNLKIDYEDINITLLIPDYEIGIEILTDKQEIRSEKLSQQLHLIRNLNFISELEKLKLESLNARSNIRDTRVIREIDLKGKLDRERNLEGKFKKYIDLKGSFQKSS